MVSHDDLNVSLLIETGAWVDRPALGKYTPHGVHSRQALCLKNAVQAANYCAIKVASASVCTVCGQLYASGGGAPYQAVVCDPHPLDSCGSSQIEAQPKLQDGADYERILDAGRFPSSCLSREIQTSLRVGLPEINPWTQPIIVVVARAEGVPSEKPLPDPAVATVIAKNKRRSETVQWLTVVLSELARLGIDALRDQNVPRSVARLSDPRSESLRGVSEAHKCFAAADVNSGSRTILLV